jgi:putative redox protein
MVKITARRREGLTHDVEIEGRGHSLVIDEPGSAGGGDRGPAPTHVLGAALAACTAITIEMYAERKGWDLGRVEVGVAMEYDEHVPTSFTVTTQIPNELSAEQCERIKQIAGRCPVHRALSQETEVSITDLVVGA